MRYRLIWGVRELKQARGGRKEDAERSTLEVGTRILKSVFLLLQMLQAELSERGLS